MDVISSPHNPAVKLAKSLALKKHRSATGLFLAEGSKVLAQARAAGWRLHTLFVGDTGCSGMLLDWSRARGARCLEVSRGVMAKLSPQENVPDAVAILHQQTHPPPADPAPDAVWLAVEDIRDPGNLGTIIRTIDAAGAAGVILVGQSCDPFSREAVRASVGSLFNVPVVPMAVSAFASLAAAWPGEVIATAARAGHDFRTRYRLPALLVLGSEGTGLSPQIRSLAANTVHIPMAGHAESLNVAIAAALLVYEIRRPQLRSEMKAE
jgi:TrmH family RNA methyltransferase